MIKPHISIQINYDFELNSYRCYVTKLNDDGSDGDEQKAIVDSYIDAMKFVDSLVLPPVATPGQ